MPAGLRALALLAALAGPGRAQEVVSPSARADIQHVITAQIEAFRHNDGTMALSFATPALRRKFGDGATFLAMVRTAYPAVFRPSTLTFGDLAPEAGGLQQKVELIGPHGEPVLALYDMQHEPDGSWRIAGCALTDSEQISL